MSYLTTKKIFPGNWNEALNSWYQNIVSADGVTGSYGGPTSVLAIPGWRYFQFMGYVPVISGSASPITEADVVIPSPYQNDSTRPNITGMVISGNTDRPCYIYRTAMRVPEGGPDGRVAEGIYTNTATHVVSFGISNGGSPTAASGEPVAQANIASNASAFIAAGSQGLGTNPIITATGEDVTIGVTYRELTDAQTFKVFSKATANSTTIAGNFFISDAAVAANQTGYVFVEICFIQPDDALGYSDLSGYLPNQQEPRGSY